MKKIQSKIGFNLLLNDSRVINCGNNKFNIVGVENWGAGNFNKDGDLDKAMVGMMTSFQQSYYLTILHTREVLF